MSTPETTRPTPPPLWQRSLIVMAGIAVILIVVELIDAARDYSLDNAGIVSRQVDGLDGILWAPFLHADFEHLWANLFPGLLLGFLVLLTRHFLAATAIIWVCSGLGVWLIGPSDAITIGASGIVFGWLTFLMVRGIFNRALWQVLGGVVLFFVYGSILWGIFPQDGPVSWQGHLCGALGGVLAAWVLRDDDRNAATPAGALPTA